MSAFSAEEFKSQAMDAIKAHRYRNGHEDCLSLASFAVDACAEIAALREQRDELLARAKAEAHALLAASAAISDAFYARAVKAEAERDRLRVAGDMLADTAQTCIDGWICGASDADKAEFHRAITEWEAIAKVSPEAADAARRAE